MKKIVCALTVCLSLAAFLFAADQPTQKNNGPLTSDSAKLSYALGMEIGKGLKGLQTDIDLSILAQGLESAYKDTKPLLSEQEAASVKQAFFAKLQEKRMQEMKMTGEKNKKEADAFLAENKKKSGVITTASGLQYIVLKEGTGAQPKATDKVKVNYKGNSY